LVAFVLFAAVLLATGMLASAATEVLERVAARRTVARVVCLGLRACLWVFAFVEELVEVAGADGVAAGAGVLAVAAATFLAWPGGSDDAACDCACALAPLLLLVEAFQAAFCCGPAVFWVVVVVVVLRAALGCCLADPCPCAFG
jgi:hypothetical protein